MNMMITDVSNEQNLALRAIREWLSDPSGGKFFFLGGFAGTGKTTLARYIADEFVGSVGFAAPTNKAASVLRSKGCEGAQTIHSLLYTPQNGHAKWVMETYEQLREMEAELIRAPNPIKKKAFETLNAIYQKNNGPRFGGKETEQEFPNLIIVDEASMIDVKMGTDLLNKTEGARILLLGDPAQLPPVNGPARFTKPDFLLTEIHRQERGNPILELATMARLGQELRIGTYGDSRVLAHPDEAAVFASDMALCYTNRSRHQLNEVSRRHFGLKDTFAVGEVMFGREANRTCGVEKGDTYKIVDFRFQNDKWHVATINLSSEKSIVLKLAPTNIESIGDDKAKVKLPFVLLPCLAYGHAITVHSSQGSQWDDVYLNSHYTRDDREKWLYTAITRAARKITIS
ncbi:ATP-dependent DNA helicase [Aureimonas altamirensis]|uniref:ATP-dependent DNA helicase n=1 Tax=Aureimonas altamirensis TaxID=370622 RepID=UPI0025555257|nr:AAA family ATPase [Aureimonas altamirensis]